MQWPRVEHDEKSYPSVFADVVKQLTTGHILHDHEEICGRTYHLVPETQTCLCSHQRTGH